MKTYLNSFKIILITILVVGCTKSNDENLPRNLVSWVKSVNFKSQVTWPQNVTGTSDGGFLICGSSTNEDSNILHGFITRLNTDGDTIWNSRIDLEGFTGLNIYDVIELSPEKIVIAGQCGQGYVGQHKFIAWLDNKGKIARTVFYPLPEEGQVNDSKLMLLSNGNLYYACSLYSSGDNATSGMNIVTLEVVDEMGQVIRSNTYEDIYCLMERLYLLEDDYLLMVGRMSGSNAEDVQMAALLIDDSGNEVFREKFGSPSYGIAYAACQDQYDGFVVSGLMTYSNKLVLFPVSRNGVVGEAISLADSIYGYSNVIRKALDGGYHVFFQSWHSLYCLKLDANFNEREAYVYENPWPSDTYPCFLRDFVSLSDGSYAFLYRNDAEGGTVLVRTVPL